MKRALRRRSETRARELLAPQGRSAGRAGVRDVFGTCAGAGAVAGWVCEAARVCDGADAGVCADSAGDARDVVIARMRLRQWRVLNASSLSYLNLSCK